MATRTKPNWKVLDRLLPVLEKEGWSHAQIADDWGISLTILEGHLEREGESMPKRPPDWSRLDPLITELKAEGWNDTKIAKDLGIARQTLVDHLRSHEPGTPTVHQGTPEHFGVPQDALDFLASVHQSTPEHAASAPDDQYTRERLGTPDEPDPSEVHPSTPEVHQEMSPIHSGVPEEHSGVPARQDHLMSTPMVHPGTPSQEDWELWSTIKARWLEVEKMLADRQAFLSTPSGTPRQTQKKTYVFDVQHIAMIEEYARVHRLELKDVIYTMCEEFFQRR